MITSGLELTSASVGYRRRFRAEPHLVVDRIDAVATPGTLTAVLGPNGAGKSTLLRSVLGLQPFLAGTARLNGEPIDALDHGRRARLVAAVLTERVDSGLLSGREIARLGRYPYAPLTGRLTRAEHLRVEETLDRVGARGFAGQRFDELSDGQRQRVLLARALITRPRLLIVDEPTAFLDVGARIDLMILLQETAASTGLTIVASTHEVELALRTADQLWLIDSDRLRSGTPDEVVASGMIGEVFETPRTRFDPTTLSFTPRPPAPDPSHDQSSPPYETSIGPRDPKPTTEAG